MKIFKDIAKKAVTFLAVKNKTKIAIRILQGSAVAQNAFGGLLIYQQRHCGPFLRHCVE